MAHLSVSLWPLFAIILAGYDMRQFIPLLASVGVVELTKFAVKLSHSSFRLLRFSFISIKITFTVAQCNLKHSTWR